MFKYHVDCVPLQGMRKLGKILLIVDDDSYDRLFFKNAIEEIDAAILCLEAGNGIEALELLKEATVLPDFIFLDLNMPLMDGKECLAELKRDAKLKDIPVIIYSTSDYIKDIEDTRKLGAAHYLTKTADIFKLPEYISDAIKKASEHVLSLNRVGPLP